MSAANNEPTAFTPEQVTYLFRACRMTNSSELLARDHAIVALLLDSGIHGSELVTLRRDRLRVSGGPEDEAYVVVSPKGRDQYRTPLGLHARKALERYLKESRPQSASRALFLDEMGKPLTPQALSRLLARLGERVEEVMADTPVTARTFHQTYLATRSKLAAGESVLDSLDEKTRRKQRGWT